MSFSVFASDLDPAKGYTSVPASVFPSLPVSLMVPILVTELSSEEAVISFRHALLERYAPKALLKLGREDTGEIWSGSIEELNYPGEGTWSALLRPSEMIRAEASDFSLEPILSVMKALREEGGCPWDRAQDHATLRTYLIQEAYEAVDAIDHKDMENLKEELGDVLYQIVFHARIAEEEGAFTMQDVVDGIAGKMVARHPYVFGTMTAAETAELLGNWEVRKIREKNRSHLLSGLSGSLPSLAFACIMQKKVSSVSKDTVSAEEIGHICQKAWETALAGAAKGNGEDKERSFGKALFETVRYLSALGVDPELSLHRYSRLYQEALERLEDRLGKEGKSITDITPAMLKDLVHN